MSLVGELLISLLLILGAAAVVTGARSLFVEKDAISRVNAFGITTTLGLPFITAGAMFGRFLTDGFTWEILLKSLGAILAFVLVSSVASNTLTRAVYMSGAPIDPETCPNDLSDPNPHP
ncbi:MAG: monovalent cation/H(+) antiporter subunit G [Propionibacteriaceae bacterium]|nr:monovalent cation/H(+) antiporter subunit G [Propionibacteriaceae bacterium]